MKIFPKRFYIIISILSCFSLFLLICGCIRTNQSVLLKGDTTDITELVEIDTNYEQKGSFSSIYVISFDHSTVLQNFFVSKSRTSIIEPINSYYTHFSDKENYEMGQVQKNSSIMTALITAYNAVEDPSIHLPYSFRSLCVDFYFKDSPFRIADEIIKINDISAEEYVEFEQAVRYSKKGDVVMVRREGKEVEISLSANAYSLCRWYPYFDIDYENATPKIKINKTNSGGPSGGLLQTLSIYNRLIVQDLTKGLKISGTGTMSVSNAVGPIGGIKQKIYTAYDNHVDVFFCPAEDYEEALEAYNTLKRKERMALCRVETLQDAIRYLENV